MPSVLRISPVSTYSLTSNEALFKAMMERTLQQQKIWEEILRKLREGGGGGGGGSRRYDKIAMSMKWTNFLSSKFIHNLMQSAKNLPSQISTNTIQTKNVNHNQPLNFIQKAGFFLSKNLSNIVSLFTKGNFLTNAQKTIFSISKEILQIVSFQLNKLKEFLEQEFKEATRKMDIKERIDKAFESVVDFFVKLIGEVIHWRNYEK